jgi:hypothetical protein
MYRIVNCARASTASRLNQKFTAPFSRVSRGRKGRKAPDEDNIPPSAPPAPALTDPNLAWTEVRDKSTGQLYYWNTVTNETTALGAPNPTTMAPSSPPQVGTLRGLGSVMAEGLAFGTGSAIAHNVIGSMFGGHSSDSGNLGGGFSDSGGDSWDI